MADKSAGIRDWVAYLPNSLMKDNLIEQTHLSSFWALFGRKKDFFGTRLVKSESLVSWWLFFLSTSLAPYFVTPWRPAAC
jgi:hypothetical protein